MPVRWTLRLPKPEVRELKLLVPNKDNEVKLMAIMAMFTGKGFTKDMYERLRQEVGWETEPIDGWILHAVCFDESGDIRMINIWESTEKMEQGFVNRLMPVMQKIGIPPPRAEIYPAHNINVFATAK